MLDHEYVRALERSHDELRGALIFAGRRIRKLTFGRKDDPTRPVLLRVLKDARLLKKTAKSFNNATAY